MPEGQGGIDELGDFLDTHYEKFAIMGIFGSVTVFLSTNWPGSSNTLTTRVGIVASLLIFSLAALWISVKCYQLLREAAGEWPKVPQLGYAVILTGTLALGSAVLSASQIYTASTQLLGEFLFAIIFGLVYATVYPGVLELPSQDDTTKFETISTFAVLGGAYLSAHEYGELIRLRTQFTFDLDFVLFAPIILVFGFQFFALRESLIGVAQIVERDEYSLRQELTKHWRIRTSLAISVSSVVFLMLYLHHTARQAVGPNLGYYQVYGMPAKEYTLLHWLVIPILFALLILIKRHSSDFTERIRQTGKAVAVLVVLLLILEIAVVIPEGTHVIPL